MAIGVRALSRKYLDLKKHELRLNELATRSNESSFVNSMSSENVENFSKIHTEQIKRKLKAMKFSEIPSKRSDLVREKLEIIAIEHANTFRHRLLKLILTEPESLEEYINLTLKKYNDIRFVESLLSDSLFKHNTKEFVEFFEDIFYAELLMHVNRFVEFFGKKIKPRLKFASRELTNKERTMAIKVLGILGKYGLRFEDLDKVITDIESFYGNPFAILHANFRANPFDKELSIISELFKACNNNKSDSELMNILDKYDVQGIYYTNKKKKLFGLNRNEEFIGELAITHELIHYALDEMNNSFAKNEFVVEYISHLLCALNYPEYYEEYKKKRTSKVSIIYDDPLNSDLLIQYGFNLNDSNRSRNPYINARVHAYREYMRFKKGYNRKFKTFEEFVMSEIEKVIKLGSKSEQELVF